MLSLFVKQPRKFTKKKRLRNNYPKSFLRHNAL
jgi:hypothetical protein